VAVQTASKQSDGDYAVSEWSEIIEFCTAGETHTHTHTSTYCMPTDTSKQKYSAAPLTYCPLFYFPSFTHSFFLFSPFQSLFHPVSFSHFLSLLSLSLSRSLSLSHALSSL